MFQVVFSVVFISGDAFDSLSGWCSLPRANWKSLFLRGGMGCVSLHLVSWIELTQLLGLGLSSWKAVLSFSESILEFSLYLTKLLDFSADGGAHHTWCLHDCSLITLTPICLPSCFAKVLSISSVTSGIISVFSCFSDFCFFCSDLYCFFPSVDFEFNLPVFHKFVRVENGEDKILVKMICQATLVSSLHIKPMSKVTSK